MKDRIFSDFLFRQSDCFKKIFFCRYDIIPIPNMTGYFSKYTLYVPSSERLTIASIFFIFLQIHFFRLFDQTLFYFFRIMKRDYKLVSVFS